MIVLKFSTGVSNKEIFNKNLQVRKLISQKKQNFIKSFNNRNKC